MALHNQSRVRQFRYQFSGWDFYIVVDDSTAGEPRRVVPLSPSMCRTGRSCNPSLTMHRYNIVRPWASVASVASVLTTIDVLTVIAFILSMLALFSGTSTTSLRKSAILTVQ